MDLNTVLDKYGLIGVLILMLPYFIKEITPALKQVFGYLFVSQKTRAAKEKQKTIREELLLQAEIQEAAKKTEHDRWMYETTFSVLKENLSWIRNQFGVVQKKEEDALSELNTKLDIAAGQIDMLTKTIQRMQEIVYNINERCIVCNIVNDQYEMDEEDD